MTLILSGGGGGGGAPNFMRGLSGALNSESDHFDEATLAAKWVVGTNTMGNGYDVNTTVQSALVAKPTAAGQTLNLSQVVSHAGDVSYTCIAAQAPGANYNSIGMVLYNSAGATDGVMVDWKYSSGRKVAMSHRTAGSWTFDNIVYTVDYLASFMCFHIQRIGNIWTVGLGEHPYAIYPLGGTLNKTIGTIVRMELNMNTSGNRAPFSVDAVLRDYVYL